MVRARRKEFGILVIVVASHTMDLFDGALINC